MGKTGDISDDVESGMNRTTVKRWSKISLRSLHLLAIAGVGGGILFALEKDLWINYWWLALVSGVLMMLMDIASNPVWLIQVRGVVILLKLILLVLLGINPVWIVQVRGIVIMLKLLLLALLGSNPGWDSFLLAIIIIISAVISHAPGKLRYYSFYHRRVINSDNDAKG